MPQNQVLRQNHGVKQVKKEPYRFSETKPPKSLYVAQDKHSKLVIELKRVAAHLKDQNRNKDVNWVHRTKDAQRHMQLEFDFLAKWIHEERTRLGVPDNGADPQTVHLNSLLNDGYKLIMELSEQIKLTEKQWATVNSISEHLHNKASAATQ